MKQGQAFEIKETMANRETHIHEDGLKVLNDVANAIAQLQWDNWDVIQQYQWMQNRAEQIEYEARQKHGDFATSGALQTAIQNHLAGLQDRNAPRKKGGRLKTRISPQMKLDVLLDMLRDFAGRDKNEVTLKQINEWFSEPPKAGYEDCRDLHGLRNTKIIQTQWFAVKAGTERILLYQPQHYVSKKPPYPSTFKVKPWLKWLEQNEEKLAERILATQRGGRG